MNVGLIIHQNKYYRRYSSEAAEMFVSFNEKIVTEKA